MKSWPLSQSYDLVRKFDLPVPTVIAVFLRGYCACVNVSTTLLWCNFILSDVSLKQKDKELLEKVIDEEISKIPGLLKDMHLPNFKDTWQIKDESEYVYGYVHGAIVGKFETVYFLAHSGKRPSVYEIDEIAKTIFGRTSKIRDAILKMG